MVPKRKLYRSNDAVVFGVCGGLAEYLDFSPVGMRIAWVLLTLLLLGPLTLLAYVIMALVLKPAPALPPVPRCGLYADGGTLSRTETLLRLKQRFEVLDRRLQDVESAVTKPSFRFDDECRELSGQRP